MANRTISMQTLRNAHSIVFTDYYGWRDASKKIKTFGILYYVSLALLSLVSGLSALAWANDVMPNALPLYLAAFVIHTLVLIVDYFLKWWTYPIHINEEQKTGRIRFVFSWLNIYLLLAIILPLVGTLVTIHVGRDTSNDAVAGLILFFIPRYSQVFSIINVIPGVVILKKAIAINKSIFYTIMTIFAIVVGFGAGAIFAAENGLTNDLGEVSIDAFWDALYFTMIAMTSVGLGDIVPLTLYGKIITVILGVVGVIMFAIPAGIIAGSFSKAYKEFYDDPGNKHSKSITERVRERMVETSSIVLDKAEKMIKKEEKKDE